MDKSLLSFSLCGGANSVTTPMPPALLQEVTLRGSKLIIPPFLYGTAWKQEKTANLVYEALCSGFRGVDTAAQPKHYLEDLVGDGIRRALGEGKVKREDLFVVLLQTAESYMKLEHG